MALIHEELTEKIIGLCMEVHRELGHGYSQSVYHAALLIAFRDAELNAASEVAIDVRFRGENVGKFYADIVVEGCVLLELKALSALTNDHKSQVINYLKGTGLEVGLLINFGQPSLKFHRLEHPGSYRAKQS
jgi:GxxExxY protein